MLPRKILDFWTLQNAILGVLASFSYIIECNFGRSLGKRNRICAHANEMHRYAFTRSFGSRLSPTSRSLRHAQRYHDLYVSMWHGDASSGLAFAV